MKKKVKKQKKAYTKKVKIYPDYILSFKHEVESKTPLIVKIDQYAEDNSFHVGVLKKRGKVYHCIWMVGFVTGSEYLKEFWNSLAFKSFMKD